MEDQKPPVDNSKTNLIINYLPQTMSDEQFRQLFDAIGTLESARILRDKRSGYSYGYGFVNYQSEEDASKAIDSLNGLQLEHKTIKVAYARPPTEDIRGANLYVANLPKSVTQDELTEMFSSYGEIINVKILTDNFSGASKGCGFVLFATKSDAEAAIGGLHATKPDGATQLMTVKKAKDDDDKSLGSRPPPQVVPQPKGFYSPYSAAPQNRGGTMGGGPMRRNNAQYRYNPTGYPQPLQASASASAQGGFILFVYNIGPDADETLMYSLFAPYGAVAKVNVMKDPEGKGKGFGFVTMVNHDEAVFAISQLDGYVIKGKPLQVSFKK